MRRTERIAWIVCGVCARRVLRLAWDAITRRPPARITHGVALGPSTYERYPNGLRLGSPPPDRVVDEYDPTLWRRIAVD